MYRLLLRNVQLGGENVTYFAVGLGGILGALLRYFIGLWGSDLLNTSFPVATLAINLLGSFLLAWFLTRMSAAAAIHPAIHPVIRTGFSTGFIGSFTTFSTFSIETVTLLQKGQLATAFCYIFLSALGGIMMACFGYVLADSQVKTQKERTGTT